MKVELFEQVTEAIKVNNWNITESFEENEYGEFAIFFENGRFKGEYKSVELTKGIRVDLYIHRNYNDDTQAAYFTERMADRYIESHEKASVSEVLAFINMTCANLDGIEKVATNKF